MSDIDMMASSMGAVNLQAARDINFVTQSDNVFIEPDLAQYKPLRFPLPRDINLLIDTIERQHMLILSGESGVDKSELARHVAWYLADKLGQPQAPLVAREWDRRASFQILLQEIQKTTNNTIFLLPKITPQDIHTDDLLKLQDIAKQHYLLLSTDIPFDRWSLTPAFKQSFWQELSQKDIFSISDLTEMLIVRLIEVRDALPQGLAIDTIAPNVPLCGTITPTDIATQLQTFNKIRAFVSFLRSRSAPIQEHEFRDLITKSAQIDSIESYFREWYHNTLKTRDRLLALNLSFFDGLYEEQFFAALERLMANVWVAREPGLRAFDYDDIAPLDLFFGLTPTRSAGRIVESRSYDQRRMLLIEAWHNHRRQILAALPHLVSLVKESVQPRAQDRELFGTRARRVKFREVIADTISNIGMISVEAIQTALLELALDQNLGVQLVAARAMAAWRYYQKDQQLFEFLDGWQTSTYALEIMRAIQRDNERKDDERPETYIRATIALTVGQAGSYDAPNQLAKELLDLFVALSNDQNRLVRHRFMNYTLPQVVVIHLNQIHPQLRLMTRYIDLDWPIAASLGIAYRIDPKTVMRVLALWHNETIAVRPTQPLHPKKVTLRETLIATVALTYGEIDYDLPNGPLSADEGFKRLQIILKDELHPFVRTAVVIAITNQARRNFAHVAPALQECLVDVATQEREEIVKILVESYNDQRANIPNGHELVNVSERRYPIWQPLEARPLTEIEQILLAWLKDDRYPVAQQIAVRSLIAFESAIDRPIRERAIQQQEERQRLKAAEEALAPLSNALNTAGQVSSGWYQQRFVPWIVTLGSPEYKRIVQVLLPEVLQRKKEDTASTNLVLQRLSGLPDQFLMQISQRLQRAIGLVEQGCIIQIVIAFVLFLGLCMLLRTLQAVGATIVGR